MNTRADIAPWVGNDLKGNRCDGGGQGFGPFDYTKRNSIDPGSLIIVETNHFTPNVENLIKGQSSDLDGDLNYTLRAWPNHHRALLSVIRYQLKISLKLTPNALKTPPECYLQRAIKFSPEDAASYSLFGYYLSKLKEFDIAKKYYDKAMAIEPENAKIAYSYSLMLIDMKHYEEAAKLAKIAYRQKNTPKTLKLMLEKIGAWQE